MGKVRIEVMSPLAETLGVELKRESAVLDRQIEAGATVRQVINGLLDEYPRLVNTIFDVRAQKLTEKVNIFINGRNLELENGLATELNDGDALTLVTPIVGG